MKLIQQQQQFAKCLTQGAVDPTLLTHPQHITIYQHHLRENIKRTMSEAYPLILALVGEAFFNTAVYFYQQQYPSKSGDLATYGAHFSDFLQSYLPAQSLPYLAEVATLEWACQQIYYAANAAPFTLAMLADTSPEQLGDLRLKLHPACRLFNFKYPVLKIWQLCQQVSHDQARVDLDSGGVLLLVWRQEFTIQLQALSSGEFTLLSSIEQHLPLATAIENSLHIEAELDMVQCLQRFEKMGIFI